MIRTIKIQLNAAYPNMPLDPFNVFHDSSAAVTILNVPRIVTAVALKIKNVAGISGTFIATRTGSSWVATIPGLFFAQSGTSTMGVKIEGTDAAGNVYTLGSADLVVLKDDGTVTPVPAGAGDVRHADFASVNPDTASLADIITILKGQVNA